MAATLVPMKLEPQYREYIWGGNHIRPGQLTAEAWVVHEDNQILSGPLAGKTLIEACSERGPEILGINAVDRTPGRFPLLIKLLDCAQWLSLQVHPNNAQAVALEGEGQFGKTEAWHILHAEAGAEIYCGFQQGISENKIFQSVQDGNILDYMQKLPMNTGDTVYIPAGTVHALGPGLLVYEVQQTSDITYRVFDWNRPASAGRKLHIEQSLAVMNPSASSRPIPEPEVHDGERIPLVKSPFFQLDLLNVTGQPVKLNTHQASFHALTAIAGEVTLTSEDSAVHIAQYDTVLVPASLGGYVISPHQNAKILISSID